MPDPNAKPPLTHDDYCRIYGRVVFDAFFRIDSLERQLGPLYETFQSQTEALRVQLAECRKQATIMEDNYEKEIEDLKRRVRGAEGELPFSPRGEPS